MKMKKLIFTKKFISLLMAFVMLFGCIATVNLRIYALPSDNTVSFDGYDFYILWNNFDGVGLKHSDGNTQNIFQFDRFTTEITVISTYTNPYTRALYTEFFNIVTDPSLEYVPGYEMRGLMLVNVSSGESYDLDELQYSRFVVPLGIPLTYAAMLALLAIGAAIIINGIAHTAAGVIAQDLANQNRFHYFTAEIRNNDVMIGGALTHNEARTLIGRNHGSRGVWAINAARARGVAGSNPFGPEIHSDGEGRGNYYYHFHPRVLGGIRGLAHIWFW